MKKQILNIGKALTRAEQKQVFGGNVLTEDDQEVNYNCYASCKDGNNVVRSAFNCDTAADNACAIYGGWTSCSCWAW